MKRIEAATSMEDLQGDPKAYGLPTFEEFQRQPDLWRVKKDQSFAALDAGFTNHKMQSLLKKAKYKIHGLAVPSLEYAERAVMDYGYTIEDLKLTDGQKSKLKFEMNMIPQGAGNYDIEVNFLP